MLLEVNERAPLKTLLQKHSIIYFANYMYLTYPKHVTQPSPLKALKTNNSLYPRCRVSIYYVEIVQWTCDLTNNGSPNPHSYLVDNPDLDFYNPNLLVSFGQLPSYRAVCS